MSGRLTDGEKFLYFVLGDPCQGLERLLLTTESSNVIILHLLRGDIILCNRKFCDGYLSSMTNPEKKGASYRIGMSISELPSVTSWYYSI